MSYRDQDTDTLPTPPRVPTYAEAHLASTSIVWSELRFVAAVASGIGLGLGGIAWGKDVHLVPAALLPTALAIVIGLYSHRRAEALYDIQRRYAASRKDA